MDRGAWWATVHRIAKSHTTEQLTLYTFAFEIIRCKTANELYVEKKSLNGGLFPYIAST